MPDPAERIRPVKKVAAKPARRSRWVRALVALAPKSRRGFAGAGLAAMMIGIVVNAVALQHGRRLELPPLPATAAVAPPAPAPAPTATVAATSAEPTPPMPPARPTPTALALAHAGKSADGIGEFLRANSADTRRLVASAQTALAKLGYSVKSTGTMNADTRGALAEFEKSHGIAVSTEITPKLLRTLTAAAAAN